MSDYNFTDSTSQSLKDPEPKYEIKSDPYYNGINISAKNAELENIRAIFHKYEKNWKLKSQKTYQLNHDIERVWIITVHFDILALLSNDGHFPCINIKGKDTFNLGNIFKGNLYKKIPFIARVEKKINLPEIKQIDWLFYSIDDDCFFIIKIKLYKINDDNSTLVLKETKLQKKLTNLDDKLIDFNSNKLFKSVDELLKNETINLLKYESGIIRGKMEDIYNILTDYNKISAIAPNNQIIPNINMKDLKLNEKTKVAIIGKNGVQKIDITLKYKEINPGWNKWSVALEISGGEPKKIAHHCLLINLTKINNLECQLIMCTKYHEAVSSKELNECNIKKKYLIMSLKDYFENFYSPDIKN